MSENIGSILGYLRLDRSDWDNEIRAAMAKADELGRKSPNIKIGTNAPSAIAQLAAVAAAVKRLQDAQGAENVAQAKLTELQGKGNVSAGRLAAAQERLDKAHRSTAAAAIALAAAEDAGDRAAAKAAMDTAKLGAAADKTTASFKIGLIPALAMLAPAAIPIAGVAGGALLGLLPVAATVELGIKGIENQMKKGAVQGTAFAASVNALKAELGTLEQNAAGGLMAGINTALSKSGPLFETVNRDVSVMSGELGQIVGSAAPSLVKILTDLDPLFQTFGQGLVRGAADLERWANSSDGISRFVAYVQSELPTVEHTLANVITLIAHLAEGAAPFGGVLLNDINLFVGALDKIPVPLLQTAVPVVAALYAAVKTNQAVTVGVTALNNALGLTGPKAVAAAQAQNAASLQVQATAAAEAAGVARAKATEAASAAEAAAQIAASTEATSSVLAAGAAASAEAAAEFAASMQAEASAAEATAAQVAASSEAASAAVAASGEAAAAASVGFGSMLGPLGAVVVGGGLLASVFMHSGQSAQQAAQQVNTYTQALEASRGAINDDVRSKVALALANTDAGRQAAMFGVSHEQLINLIISGGPALTSLKAKLDDAGSALGSWTGQAKSGAYYTRDQSEAGIGLSKTLGMQSSAFGKAVAQANEYRSYMGEATQATKSQSQALAELNTKLGITVSNLLSAAQSEDQFKTAVLNVTSSVKQNGTSLSMNTSKGLANRDALLAAMQAALSYRDAQEKSGVSTRKANLTLAANIQQLEDSAIHAGLSKTAVEKLVRQMGLVPKNIRTDFAVNTSQAMSALARAKQMLDALHSKTVAVTVVTQAHGVGQAVGIGGHHAAGGTVSGPGTGTSDSVPIMASTGEEVINAKQAAKHRPLLKAINAGVDGFATGGTVGNPLVLAAISAATTPAPTTVPPLSMILAQHIRGASATEASKSNALESYKDAVAQLHAVTVATNQHVAAARHEAQETQITANKAKLYAQSLPTSTKAQRDAKKAAEDHARSLQLVATRARNAETRVKNAAKAQETAAKNVASTAKAAYQAWAQSAQNATGVVTQSAKDVVAAYQSSVTAFLQTVDAFKATVAQDFAQGGDIPTIWQALTGTDANGNPILPTGAQLDAGLQGFLATAQKFKADLDQVIAEGGSQDVVTQILGMGPQAGDQLAQALLGAGQTTISSLSATLASISQLGTSAGSDLSQQFYGAGAQSIDNIGKGILAEFPSLQKAIAPILATLAKEFTLTPTITAPVVAAGGVASVPGAGKHGGSPTVMVPYSVPGFASGVTDFAGGLAYVHRDELLVNLPRGTDVIPANRAKNAFGASDNSAVVTELRALNARVSSLANDIGQVQAHVGAGLYAQAGQAHAQQTRRAFRKGALG